MSVDPPPPARVWVIDDGEKVRRDALDLPFARGENNPVWAPGKPVRLVAMRNETVALQVVVEAGGGELSGVTVDLARLAADSGAVLANAPGATDPTLYVGRPIERFVEHFVNVTRASGGKTPGESLGWAAGAAPPPAETTGLLPDALVPVEAAPAWEPYPMRIPARANGVVWIDVTTAKDQASGVYRGEIVVQAAGAALAMLPVELDVAGETLPDRTVATMLYYDRSELDRRIAGGDDAERALWRLLHRHRIAPLHDAKAAADLDRQFAALDGSFYTPDEGYDGPGVGIGDGVLALGAYGEYGAPDASKLAEVERVADALAARHLLEATSVFVYAADEDCESPSGAAWSKLLRGSHDPNARAVRVAWTCDEGPAGQPVDVAILHATFDPDLARRARDRGKDVWVYNGERPFSGTFLLDAEAVSPRVDGWLEAAFGIGRWFYWESTFWYDDNKGGHGAVDPFVTAETFHNADGDHANGDGVLVYPGRQVDAFGEHSANVAGVFPSIRLKNWRRGVEDAGYYVLAHARSPALAEAVARHLLPRVLSSAKEGEPASWSPHGAAFFEARHALLALIEAPPDGDAAAASPPPAAPPPLSPQPSCGCRGCTTSGSSFAPLGLGMVAWGARRWKRRAAASPSYTTSASAASSRASPSRTSARDTAVKQRRAHDA